MHVILLIILKRKSREINSLQLAVIIRLTG